MGCGDFPSVRFGICPRCGNTGIDIDSDTGESTTGTGYELKEYEGKWLCQLCINELEDRKDDDINLDRIIEEEKSRDLAGFDRT